MRNEEYEKFKEDARTEAWAGTGIKFLASILFVLVIMVFLYPLITHEFFLYQKQAEFLFTYAPLP
jgi:hypothetical protein